MAKQRRIARQEPTWPAKLLILNKLKLAERVGFVPDEPALINNLSQFSTAQIARNAENLSIRYKTGTAVSAVRNRFSSTTRNLDQGTPRR